MAEMLSHAKAFAGAVAGEHNRAPGTRFSGQFSAMRSVIRAQNGCRSGVSSSMSRQISGLKLAVDEKARKSQDLKSYNPKRSLGIGRAQKWWEKGHQPNMKEVNSAQDLTDSLLSAGDKLVVVDFFSPGCGGCKALHPKICQLAEMNPEVLFLQVNYEEHKSMCYSLNVHVLPFFRFYRGATGRVCSFSCTNATIKKFKDALAKYGANCCIPGPPKGLEEKELIALAANRDLGFTYKPKSPELTPLPQVTKEFSLPQATRKAPLPQLVGVL